MARTNRWDVLPEGEIQVVHCLNRCVRRAYLCGQHPLTGTDYEHQRELIRLRMEFVAGVMGIEVLGYAVMSNHFHCVLRSRHAVVATWSDDDVALKWWMLCPARRNPDGSPASTHRVFAASGCVVLIHVSTIFPPLRGTDGWHCCLLSPPSQQSVTK